VGLAVGPALGVVGVGATAVGVGGAVKVVGGGGGSGLPQDPHTYSSGSRLAR